MVQILPEQPGLGGMIGRRVGAGIGEGLRALQQQKLQEMAFEKQLRLKSELQAERDRETMALLSPSITNREASMPAQAQGDASISEFEVDDPQAVSFSERVEEIPDENIAAITMRNKPLGDYLSKIKETKRQQKEKRFERGYKIAENYLKEGAAKAGTLGVRKRAAASLRTALENRDLGPFSKDVLAESLTFLPDAIREGLRSPEGAVFLNAAKHGFLGNLERVSAKGVNQWIERLIREMQPMIGRSNAVNLMVTEMIEADNEIEEKEHEIRNRLYEEFEDKGKSLAGLPTAVEKEIREFADKKQNELTKRLKEIKDEDRVKPLKKVPKGTPVNEKIVDQILKRTNQDWKKAEKIARDLGYEF